MCQLVRDGGRRCALHRHITKAMLKQVTIFAPELTMTQVEKLFVELRREGAGTMTEQEDFQTYLDNMRGFGGDDPSVQAYIERHFTLAETHDTNVDAPTWYALMTIADRSVHRSESLGELLDNIADKTALHPDEVRHLYKKYMSEVDVSRNAPLPPEFTARARREAARDNLPYDRASITAMQKLIKLANPEEERETLITHSAPTRPSTVIKSYGYHSSGRLEVVLHNNQDVIYAYKNVSEAQWEALKNAQRPGAMLRTFRSHNEYAYNDEAEATEAGYGYRCTSCGQFRSSTERHLCPNLVTREDLIMNGASTEEIDNMLATSVEAQDEAEGAPEVETVKEPWFKNPTALALPDLPNLLDNQSHLKPNEFNNSSDHASFIPLEQLTESGANGLSTAAQNLYGTTSDKKAHVLSPEAEEGTYLIRIDRVPELNRLTYENENDKEAVEAFIRAAAAETNIQRYSCGAKVVLECKIGTAHVERIVAMYNSRQVNDYLGTSVPGTSGSGNLSCFSQIALYPLSKSFTPGNSELTEEDVQKAEAEIGDLKATGAENGTVVFLETDGQLKVTALNAARNFTRASGSVLAEIPENLSETYSNGQAVAQSVHIKYNDARLQRDDVLYGVKNITSGTVTGEAVTRMTPEGEVQIVSRALKCDCSDYAEKYECVHTNLATHDIPKINQSVVVGDIELSEGLGDGADEANKHGYSLVYSPMTNRTAITVPASGQDWIHVGHSPESSPPGTSPDLSLPGGSNARYEALTAWRLANPEAPMSIEDRTFLYEYHTHANNISNGVVEGLHIQRLTERHYVDLYNSGNDVEIPFSIRTQGVDSQETVSGRVLFTREKSFEPDEVLRSLKCTCIKYQRDYRCEHTIDALYIAARYMDSVDELEENSLGLMEEEEGERPVALSTDAFRSDINLHEEVVRYARRRDISVQEADQAVKLQREEEARAEAERIRLREEGQAFWNNYRESRIALWENPGTPLSNTPEQQEAFDAEVEDIRRRKRRGETVLEFKPEGGVTDGICAPGLDTRSFGIEIEFDIHDDQNKYTALNRIGRELYELGLTDDTDQHEYHASNGDWSSWSFEEDCTVAGEIVSPPLKDTPEHWEQVRQVIDIINRNGGYASTAAGAHINISSASYLGSTAKHAALSRVVQENSDMLYRVASNPHRGHHRGARWCNPNIGRPNTDISLDSTGSYVSRGNSIYAQHGNIVNYDSSIERSDPSRTASSRIEYRLWDATLDVAVIQQQVAYSAALTDYAERETVQADGFFHQEESPESRGAEENVKAASLIDRIFRTDEQRKAATQLFAINNSTGGTPESDDDDDW